MSCGATNNIIHTYICIRIYIYTHIHIYILALRFIASLYESWDTDVGVLRDETV